MKKKNEAIDELHSNFWKLYEYLRDDTKEKWDRVLPFNELLFDRWEKANYLKTKKGANVYDSSYIFGDVSIGKNTWIGPNTILDGSGGKLKIGDYCSISSGVQIYTHQTVNWALTGGKSDYEKDSTSIGNNCYVGPNSIITMGSKIGKCSVIGAHSLVNSKIPPNSIVFGIPGKVVGKVVVKGKNVSFDYID
jgi:acetyltransferase-like isoleucine patch superfamily enzyme